MKHLKLFEQFINNTNVDVIVAFMEDYSGYKNMRKIASGGNGFIFECDNSDYFIKVTGSVEEMNNVRKLTEEKLTNVMYINDYIEEYIEELDSEYFWFEIEKLDDLDYYHHSLMDVFFRSYNKSELGELNSNDDVETMFMNSNYKSWYVEWRDEALEKHKEYHKFFKVIFGYKNGIEELKGLGIELTDVGVHNIMYDYKTNNLKIIDIGE